MYLPYVESIEIRTQKPRIHDAAHCRVMVRDRKMRTDSKNGGTNNCRKINAMIARIFV